MQFIEIYENFLKVYCGGVPCATEDTSANVEDFLKIQDKEDSLMGVSSGYPMQTRVKAVNDWFL